MSRLQLSFGCWDYDRVMPLSTGTVRPDGIDLNFLPMPPEETFWRMMRHQEFDVAELSFASYLVAKDRGTPRFTGIPVFPSRCFRHGCIFVNADSGIERPEDLRGKRIGLPEWQLTANVWVRGILQDEYGVAPTEMEWFTGGQESPGRVEKVKLELPPSVRIQPIAPDKTLNQMLEEGEIDAFMGPRTPSSFTGGSRRVRRLFPNYKADEEAYFQKTGIFPIMHLVAIRTELLEANPWIAQNLFRSFVEAKARVYQGLRQTAALKVTLPWLQPELERTQAIMGDDFWPYGLEPNRKAILALTRYAHEQGLTKRQIAVEELFAKSTLEAFTI